MSIAHRNFLAGSLSLVAFASTSIACGGGESAVAVPPKAAAVTEATPGALPIIYPVDVTLLFGDLRSSSFPAIYSNSPEGQGIVFFPSQSPAFTVSGFGVLSFSDGVPRGQGALVLVIGQGPPNANPNALTIDFAQFNRFQGNPFIVAAGGIPGGGCIFATATGPDGSRFTVRLDFVPRQG